MNGNPYFSSPLPPLAEVEAAMTDLNNALSALDGSRLNTEIKNNREKILDKKMSALQNYVQIASEGDAVKIASAGFDIKRGNQRVGILESVSSITVSPVTIPGKVNLKWKPVKKTKLYAVEFSLEQEGAWQRAGEVSKAKMIFDNLPSGTVVYFRIACINSAGRSPWSNVVSCKVY